MRAADWLAWGAVAYGGIAVTVVSCAMWYPLVRRYPVDQTMPFTPLIPLFAVASSALIPGDELTLRTASGGGAHPGRRRHRAPAVAGVRRR